MSGASRVSRDGDLGDGYVGAVTMALSTRQKERPPLIDEQRHYPAISTQCPAAHIAEIGDIAHEVAPRPIIRHRTFPPSEFVVAHALRQTLRIPHGPLKKRFSHEVYR
jgi:hypothetical protein